MECSIGSMGSRYTVCRFFPVDIPRLAKLDWNSVARRVFIDPATGVIALMSPSSTHEEYARGADRLVETLGERIEVRSVALGATRWRRREDPENTGAEPDACYYLGKSAERRTQARRQGPEALQAFELDTPPDLVVEVERSRGDETKPEFYRRLGVPEMWRLDISGNTREALILDLQAADGPVEVSVSVVLHPATPAFVLEALELAVEGRRRDLDVFVEAFLSDG